LCQLKTVNKTNGFSQVQDSEAVLLRDNGNDFKNESSICARAFGLRIFSRQLACIPARG
jgi:hypothetical protein